MGSEVYILSINGNSTSLRKPCWSLFPDTALIVIPSTSKMVGGTTYILLTTCLTAQQVNQVFIVAIKSMVCFKSFFIDEASVK